MLNRRSNWIAYILQMAFLAVFSWHMKLYGDLVNSCIYIGVGIIGWQLWGRDAKFHITRCCKTARIGYWLVTATLTFAVFLWLKRTNDPLPLLDSFTTVSSFVATYLMVTKKLDAWILWFINDLFYVLEYWLLPDQALYLLILNVLWTVMAVLSYWNWKNLLSEPSASHPAEISSVH